MTSTTVDDPDDPANGIVSRIRSVPGSFKASERSQIIYIGDYIRIICTGRPDDAAYLAARMIMFIVNDRNVPCIEGIVDASLVHPSGDPADNIVAVVDGACIVGFFHRSGETAHDAPYMAGIIGKGLIADLAFIVYVIQNRRGIRPFRCISDDAAHIDSIILFTGTEGCCVSRGIDRPQIVGAGNGAVIHHAGHTADAHVAPDIACIVAVLYRCCFPIVYNFIYTIFNISVDLAHDATCIGCLADRQNRISGDILRMNGAAVGTGDNINTISVHIARDAAHIPDDGFFSAGIPCSDPLFHETTAIPRTGGQNITAAVDAGRNGPFSAEIAGDAAYIVRAADVVFLIGGIGNTGIHCTPDDAAHVACRVVGIAVFFCGTAAHVAGILHVFNFAFLFSCAV